MEDNQKKTKIDTDDDNVELTALLPNGGGGDGRRSENRNGTITNSAGPYGGNRLELKLRAFSLGVSLSLYLATFWLLDSLKDPAFSVLVGGDLKRHQPMAKIASVIGTLLLVFLMERVDNSNKKNSIIQSDNEGSWKKMPLRFGIDTENDDCNKAVETDSVSRIPLSTFRTVGFSYALALVLISYCLRRHPQIYHRPDISSHEDENNKDVDNNKDNYIYDNTQSNTSLPWMVLGYLTYLTIESFGSIAVATFWSFVNSTLTLQAASEFYGPIIAIAQIGAIVGSTLPTIKRFTVPVLFLISAFILIFQVGGI